MDENFNNSPHFPESMEKRTPQEDGNVDAENTDFLSDGDKEESVNAFGMENIGNVRSAGGNRSIGEMVDAVNPGIYSMLGWTCAVFAAFVMPLFAIPGIIFGALANRRENRRGYAIIIANILLASVSVIYGLFALKT